MVKYNTIFHKNGVILHVYVGSENFFPGLATSGISKRFSRNREPKVVKFVFYHSKLRKQSFLLKFSNSWPPFDPHVCV